MDKKRICEAMYALPSGVVVRRKKDIVLPIAILVVGIVIVVLNYALALEEKSADVSSSLLLGAGAVIIIGGMMLLSRIFDDTGRPWHRPTNRPLRYEEHYYPTERRGEILRYVDEVAYKKLLAADSGQVSGIAVAIYRSEDLKFCAMQAYEYRDYEYRPITGIRISE